MTPSTQPEAWNEKYMRYQRTQSRHMQNLEWENREPLWKGILAGIGMIAAISMMVFIIAMGVGQ